MLFVFGYRAQKIRSKKLSVLIHSSDKHKDVESCTVEVHFQKIIDKVHIYVSVSESHHSPQNYKILCVELFMNFLLVKIILKFILFNYLLPIGKYWCATVCHTCDKTQLKSYLLLFIFLSGTTQSIYIKYIFLPCDLFFFIYSF